MEIPPSFLCDYHVHTNISACARPEMTLDRIIERAQRRGYRVLGLSDHAHPETWGRIVALRKQVDSLATSIQVHLGCEVDVLPDGSLAVSDDELAALDFVLGAPTHPLQMYDPDGAGKDARREQIEQWFALTESTCDHPVIDVIAHPLRGLHGGFEAEPLTEQLEQKRVERLLDKLYAAGFALELAEPLENRRTAFEGTRRFYRAAERRGFLFAPGSDAHGLDRLGSQCHALWLYRDLGLDESRIWRPDARRRRR